MLNAEIWKIISTLHPCYSFLSGVLKFLTKLLKNLFISLNQFSTDTNYKPENICETSVFVQGQALQEKEKLSELLKILTNPKKHYCKNSAVTQGLPYIQNNPKCLNQSWLSGL